MCHTDMFNAVEFVIYNLDIFLALHIFYLVWGNTPKPILTPCITDIGPDPLSN